MHKDALESWLLIATRDRVDTTLQQTTHTLRQSCAIALRQHKVVMPKEESTAKPNGKQKKRKKKKKTTKKAWCGKRCLHFIKDNN
eukprot:m.183370 g.183370  ORF g.183370 m.183370 type:complete len:85 (+) comp14690_c1_seq5:3040-3294(+)